ncbi:MAG: cyclic 2,3-diphosphoglycerate synthase [Candidatus Marinimicrobia bacterium]|nr:cyclic 2,3-diphosphoglycerate synthase [Candidatus Neomarinimicrobiota bacterium]
MSRKRVIILGAAGRDFHNFNTYFKDNQDWEVMGFTAAQIPDIEGRKYPAELSGELYPDGIPIYAENNLVNLIKEKDIDFCVFSYSDVSYKHVMKVGSIINAAGANLMLLGPNDTMLKSKKPVISVVATRTGCGKSQTSRKIIETLMEKGLKVVAIRHPMPYGDLVAQKVQRYSELSDLEKHACTIEEMEEYEPHIERGNVIYAGVDYEEILREAEEDPAGCDVILWDGGNNDFSFYNSDLTVTVTDPHRVGTEITYYPGEINLRLADKIIINKMETAAPENIQQLRKNIAAVNPDADVIDGASPISVDQPEVIKGKKVLVVEDGPTLTHGEMKIGAGVVAARKFGAAETVDPRPYIVGSLKETFEIYPEIGSILPAMGYSKKQRTDLEKTINATECDAVIIGTPIDLSRIIDIDKPTARVQYDLQEIGKPDLNDVLDEFVKEHNLD